MNASRLGRYPLPWIVAAAIAAAVAAAVAVAPARAQPSASSLQNSISSAQASEGSLQAGIGADNRAIGAYQGRIDDVQTRLDAIDSSLSIEQGMLDSLQGRLRAARAQLLALRGRLANDRSVLAAQLVGEYEAAPPDATTVLFSARGFSDLLERVDQLRMIADRNAQTVTTVRTEQAAVSTQAASLAVLEAHQAQVTRSVLVQHDEVAQLRLSLVDSQLRYTRARDRKSTVLGSLQSHRAALQRQLASVQAAEAAQAPLSGPVLAPGAGYSGAGFAAHGGDTGFFPAPGTNYSVGEEPAIAARLDAMGKALGLHLIGISGYRSPQHSVEVGGFADDPHTRGEASDTPGVEGVPEATLERFGLTRPFPGAAEADHIQLH
jgi:peptidoglycan hydrolase CwlO-like protein